jgi:hypothetical protein
MNPDQRTGKFSELEVAAQSAALSRGRLVESRILKVVGSRWWGAHEHLHEPGRDAMFD